MKRFSPGAAAVLALSAVITVGSVSLLGPCVHEDGSFGSCHWAGQALLGIGLLLAVLSLAALLVKELKEGALDGRKWFYHQNDADAICEDEKAVEEYDKLFEPAKVKAWQPSQEEFYIHSHSVINRD